MKKLLTTLFLMLATLALHAAGGRGYVVVHLTTGAVDSIAVSGIYNIQHSRKDAFGREHADYVSMTIRTQDGQEHTYPLESIDHVDTPDILIPIMFGGAKGSTATDGRRRVHLNDHFANDELTRFSRTWKWDDIKEYVFFDTGERKDDNSVDTIYYAATARLVNYNDLSADNDSTGAVTKVVSVRQAPDKITVYYPGHTKGFAGDETRQKHPMTSYDSVHIASVQTQDSVNCSYHIAWDGDCATAIAEKQAERSDSGLVYKGQLNHHSPIITFLTHNPRVPSVVVNKIKMEVYGNDGNKRTNLAGDFRFDTGGVDVSGGKNTADSVVLYTSYYTSKEGGWHSPRNYSASIDSTAAYMVVAPQKDVWYAHFTFSVTDTLSKIDTTYVRNIGFRGDSIGVNTFYVINNEVSDTLFSMVEMFPRSSQYYDLKFAFRNIESYFERGRDYYYGGKFAYGSSNTQNSYGPGGNYRGGSITTEFTPEYDAAYQRWGGCWREMQNAEGDSLRLAPYFRHEWTTYNGVDGVLITSVKEKGGTGKRIFLPIDPNCNHYWTVDSTKTISDYTYSTWDGATGYWRIPILKGSQYPDNGHVLDLDSTQYYQPGFVRGVIEYNNRLKGNSAYNNTLLLLRHTGEREVNDSTFSINGFIRSVRPWPKESTTIPVEEVGFVFGTDSLDLYYYDGQDKVYTDSMFVKGDDIEWRPYADKTGKNGPGHHLLLKATSPSAAFSLGAYKEKQRTITVNLNSTLFLAKMAKDSTYYVREYAKIGGKMYYNSRATVVQGFFPHTDRATWHVGDEDATLEAHVVGISNHVAMGEVGFLVSNTVYEDHDPEGNPLSPRTFYGDPRPDNSVYIKAGTKPDENMRFSVNILKGGKITKLDPKKYYIIRAALITISKKNPEKPDTTWMLAPDYKLFHPLDTITLDLPSGLRWANLGVGQQYPEDFHEPDDHFMWNDTTYQKEIPRVITDIGGTHWDYTFNDWFGRKGWTFATPANDQLTEFYQNVDFERQKRFGNNVVKVTGPSGQVMYLPVDNMNGDYHARLWSSQAPWDDLSKGHYSYVYAEGSLSRGIFERYRALQSETDMGLRRHPVMQVNHRYIIAEKDTAWLFLSTDTAGNADGRVTLYGRNLGITQHLIDNRSADNIERGFIVHNYKNATFDDATTKDYKDTKNLPADINGVVQKKYFGHIVDTAKTVTPATYNGLIADTLTADMIADIGAADTIWYRAYLQVGDSMFYGVSRKIIPLNIRIKDLVWDVHENSARLISEIDGTFFIKQKKTASTLTDRARTGFIISTTEKLATGDNGFTDETDDTKQPRKYNKEYDFTKAERDTIVRDSTYSVSIVVPKDTVYWVRAYLKADGKTLLSAPRQFGLDYVDLGHNGIMWANINVGSSYPEDDSKYFTLGENFEKKLHGRDTYIDDEKRYFTDTDKNGNVLYNFCVNDSVIKKEVKVKTTSGTEYTVPLYRGAVRQLFNCTDYTWWKHYDGTKNDAAYVQWFNKRDTFQINKDNKYISNDQYGDLVSQPTYSDWAWLVDSCTWTYEAVSGKGGYRVTAKNGNSIFLPLNGYRTLIKDIDVVSKDGSKNYVNNSRDTLYNYNEAGWYLMADSTHMLGIRAESSGVELGFGSGVDRIFSPVSHYNDGASNESYVDLFFGGHAVRPVARWNLNLTKEKKGKAYPKMRDNTLAYLATEDTVAYLKYGTAIALQGTYQVNYPDSVRKLFAIEADPTVGFVVGDNADVGVKANAMVTGAATRRLASRYFLVIDDLSKFTPQTTYYYRLYIDIGGKKYYAPDYGTFRLAKVTTGMPGWHIYDAKATLHGVVRGETASGGESGFIIGYDKSHMMLADATGTTGSTTTTFKVTASPSNSDAAYSGPISYEFTLPKDTTYYFRAYHKFGSADSEIEYGDINVFGFEYVDFGLESEGGEGSVKWANINYGYDTPYTGYSVKPIDYNFGVTEEGQKDENGNFHYKPFTRDGSGSRADAAHQAWHNVLRMPTAQELQNLIDGSYITRETLYGHTGARFTSKKDATKSIWMRDSLIYGDYKRNHVGHAAVYPQHYSSVKGMDGIALQIYDRSVNQADGTRKTETTAYVVGSGASYSGSCHDVIFVRPVWQSNIKVNDASDDYSKSRLFIHTDSAVVHPNVEQVTFFGTFLGATQQRRGSEATAVDNIDHVGFIVGKEKTTTFETQYNYDFPKDKLNTDTVFYNSTANIDLFHVDDTYWVRAYVKFKYDDKTRSDTVWYGRPIQFKRSPMIYSGDVEWKVGDQTATLHGAVFGFNALNAESPDSVSTTKDFDKTIAENTKVGIVVGYDSLSVKNIASFATVNGSKIKLNDDGKAVLDSVYVCGGADNGSFTVTMDYKKDTTYYYCTFLYYNGEYHYATYVNHFGLEFVDMGLPMKWASINVGSRFAEDRSNQYAWGETETRDTYRFGDYTHYRAKGDDEYTNLDNEIKTTTWDVAHVKWNYTWDTAYGNRGELWAMPSKDDLQMLIDSCTWEVVTQRDNERFNGIRDSVPRNISGYKVTSNKTKRSIFIPNWEAYCPLWNLAGLHVVQGTGLFENSPLWTSSRAPRDRNAYSLDVAGKKGQDDKPHLLKYHYRYHGHFVRPIAWISGQTSGGTDVSVTTERSSWVAGDSTATIYGTALGLRKYSGAKYGFLISTTKGDFKIGTSGVLQVQCKVTAEGNGLFRYTTGRLYNNRMYYYRAYLEVDGKVFYGAVKDFGIVMVDLGLPSKTRWANVNMGALHEGEHGDFYSWGDLYTKDVFTSESYTHLNTLTGKYDFLGSDIAANDTVDATYKQLRYIWRMPSQKQWKELVDNCTWTREEQAHIPGWRVTSKATGNSNSIFLPANYFNEKEEDANFYQGTTEEGYDNHDYDVPDLGYYWSSNMSPDYRQAAGFTFNTSSGTDGKQDVADNYRYRGHSLRAVALTSDDAWRADSAAIVTVGTDWRAYKDSVNFYYAPQKLPAGYKTGVLVSSTQSTEDKLVVGATGVDNLTVNTDAARSDSRLMRVYRYKDVNGTQSDDPYPVGTVYYYRAYAYNGSNYIYGGIKQFGVQPVDLGVSVQWANINVDAASPEEMGLYGTLTGKYAQGDPANAEFKGLYHIPSDELKQELLDEDKVTWTQTQLYGVSVYKVANKTDDSKCIYLLSKDPSTWGYRAVIESNIAIGGTTNNAFLSTDSTNWHAGYADKSLYGTYVGFSGDGVDGKTGKGFLVSKNDISSVASTLTDVSAYTNVVADATSGTWFRATMESLDPTSVYYYRAYVKSGNTYYLAPDVRTLGLELVDLGLPSGTRWATVSVGARQPQDSGDLYAWGDTGAKTSFTQDNYKYYSSSTGYTDLGTDISADTRYDAAALKVSGTRMPTVAEAKELRNSEYTTWTSETVNGTEVWRVTSKMTGYTDRSILLPKVNVWTSTQKDGDISQATYLTPGGGSYDAYRWRGYGVRPVASVVSTLSPTDVSKDKATLNGNVPDTKGLTGIGFEFSLSADMSDSTRTAVTVSAAGDYSMEKDGLTEGHVYYYRAYATNGTADYYGAVKIFSTKSTETAAPTAVDLGLSVKWADRNTGANLPEKEGDYYAWGETSPRRYFTRDVYRYSNGDSGSTDIGTDIAASQYDVAFQQLSGCWRMPTKAEMDELINNCKWTFGAKEGKPGYWVENATTHNVIFLPAAGQGGRSGITNNGSEGYYWTSTAWNNDGTTYNAYNLHFSARSKYDFGTSRYYGLTVRPVYQSNATLGTTTPVYIQTGSVTYNSAHTEATLSGTMYGLTAANSLTQGFIVTKDSTKYIDTNAPATAADSVNIHQKATANRGFSMLLSDNQLNKLKTGATWYVRAYVTDGTNYAYGRAVPQVFSDITTDSVHFALGNPGITFYGSMATTMKQSVKKVKFEYIAQSSIGNRITVTDKNIDDYLKKGVKGLKTVEATFESDESGKFSATIPDTAKVDIIFFRAYYTTADEPSTAADSVKASNYLSFGARYVDLGLNSGVKWLDMNLGASSAEQAGDSYRWAETEPNGTGDYTVSSATDHIGGTDLDAAHKRLGTNYRLPSKEEIDELLNTDNCTWTPYSNGYRVTSKIKNYTSRYIFLPTGTYWGSTQGAGDSSQAAALDVKGGEDPSFQAAVNDRTALLLLRPIYKEKTKVEGGDAGGGNIGGGGEFLP